MSKFKLIAALGLLMALPLLNACHTTQGAGEDISRTGTAIQDSAAKHTP